MLNILYISSQSQSSARHNLPFSLHAELALDGLDQVLVVNPPVSLFKEEDLFVRPTKEDLIKDILVCAGSLASSVQEIQIAVQWPESFEHKCVFEPTYQLTPKILEI